MNDIHGTIYDRRFRQLVVIKAVPTKYFLKTHFFLFISDFVRALHVRGLEQYGTTAPLRTAALGVTLKLVGMYNENVCFV